MSETNTSKIFKNIYIQLLKVAYIYLYIGLKLKQFMALFEEKTKFISAKCASFFVFDMLIDFKWILIAYFLPIAY